MMRFVTSIAQMWKKRISYSQDCNGDESDACWLIWPMKSYEIDVRGKWRHHYNHLSKSNCLRSVYPQYSSQKAQVKPPPLYLKSKLKHSLCRATLFKAQVKTQSLYLKLMLKPRHFRVTIFKAQVKTQPLYSKRKLKHRLLWRLEKSKQDYLLSYFERQLKL